MTCCPARSRRQLMSVEKVQTGFLNMTLGSVDSNGFQSLDPKEHLINGFQQIWISDVQLTNLQHVWCYHVNMDHDLWPVFPVMLKQFHEELRHFWRVQSGSSKVFLINRPVSTNSLLGHDHTAGPPTVNLSRFRHTESVQGNWSNQTTKDNRYW